MVDLLVPPALFLVMLGVGVELRSHDFVRLAGKPRALVAGTLGPLVVLPLLAGLLVAVLRPEPHVAAGLLLVACCPAGALSNSFVLFAGINPALSVTLTALGSVASVVAVPVFAHLSFRLFLGDAAGVAVPVALIIGQLTLLVLLPIAIGMTIRRYRPALIEGAERPLRAIGLLLVLAIVVLVLAPEGAALVSAFSLFVPAVAFTALAAAAGLGAGMVLRLAPEDRTTLAIEFAVRNLAVALFVATASLGEPRFAVFAAAFLVAQTPLVLVGSRLYLRFAA